jgi:hypothetical protein
MGLQCIAIAMVMFVPSIATWFPEHLQHEARQGTTEDVDDSMNRLEEDPYKAGQEQPEEEEEQSKPNKK